MLNRRGCMFTTSAIFLRLFGLDGPESGRYIKNLVLGNSVTVARLALDQLVGVQIPVPQFFPRWAGKTEQSRIESQAGSILDGSQIPIYQQFIQRVKGIRTDSYRLKRDMR